MLYEAIFLALIAGWVAKGKILNLAKLKLDHIWLVFAAFIIQFGMEYLGGRGIKFVFDYALVIHGFSYLLLFLFLWLNKHLPGVVLLSLGFVLNFLVIMANGGAMPVKLEGLDPAYVSMLQNNELPTYGIIDSSTVFPWLADVMINPWPIGKAFSIGDVFIAIGIFWLVFKTMRQPVQPAKVISVRSMKL